MKGIGIGSRLAMGYAAALTLALLLTGIAVHYGADAAFHHFVLDQLGRRARAIQVEVAGSQGSGVVVAPTAPVLLRGLGGAMAQVTGVGGSVLSRSRNLGRRRLPTSLRVGGLSFVSLDGSVWAATAYRLHVPGRPPLRLELALPWDPSADALDAFQRLFWLVGIATGLVALAGGHLLARATLRRVDRIREAAERIGSAADLDERLPLAGPRDELGRLAEAFNAMLDRLAASNRTQNVFVANASHELRTPVAVIRGHAAMLRRWAAQDPEALRESLGVIERQSGHLSRLIHHLLVLARQDGHQAVDPRPVDVARLAAEVVHQTAVLAGERPIGVHAAVSAFVNGDETLLRELLTVLLDNAVRFSGDRGSIEVRVDPRETQVRIEVEDDGIGIAAEDLPHVFERFYRSPAARRASPSGSGLGLTIARQVVAQHGGTITVTSRPGQGTRVRVDLPASSSDASPFPAGQAEPAGTPSLADAEPQAREVG